MDWRIRHTLALMQQHLDGPLDVAILARRVNLSASRFAHLFRMETGTSPARYLHELRLDSALMLLYDSTLSVKEVMAAVGLNDPSHFTRDFSSRHGFSPTAFRERARSGEILLAFEDPPSSSRNGQQTAASANEPSPTAPLRSATVKGWRDERAKGA